MPDFFVPLPGSPIYDELRLRGRIQDEDAYLEHLPEHFDRPYLNVTDIPDAKLEAFPSLVFNRKVQGVHSDLKLSSC